MTPSMWEIVWMCISLAGLSVYLRLRLKAARNLIKYKQLPKDSPIRIIAYARLRNSTLWTVAFVFDLIMAVLSFLRDTFNFSWEAPTGLTIFAIFALGLVAVIVEILNQRDDRIVEGEIQKSSGS